MQSLWGGYGELFRVVLAGHEPPSVIVKVVAPPRDDRSRSHRRKLRSYEVERVFYAHYASRCPAESRLPRAFVAAGEADKGLLVLEDLDAAGFRGRLRRVGPSEITAVLAWLASFHATFLAVEPEGLWRVGTYWHLATRPDELALMKHPALKALAPRLDARLNAARFRTFVHGDAKLENVCFEPRTGAVALVDFQYVGGGVGVKDVAYFLGCCLDGAELGTLVPEYLDSYFAALGLALASRLAPSEFQALESEWRELFPLAWLDFYRFLVGWAPGAYDPDPYAESLLREVVA